MSGITIQLQDGSRKSFVGREACPLRHLIDTGSVGVATIDHPAPRWSHYVYKLRQAGFIVSTECEPHVGSFPGTHGRYRLETAVTVIADREAA